MTNPFSPGKLVRDERFCNRKEEIRRLTGYALSGVNTVIYSPRRYGKTSLVKKIQENIDIPSYYCDFFGVVSVKDIINRIVSSILIPIKDKQSLFRKTVDKFRFLRPSINIDPLTGSYSLSLSIQDDRDLYNNMERLMSALRDLSVMQGKMLMIFDEFQEITEIRESSQVEGVMRSVIQETDDLAFFFIGSRRRLLLEMFTDKKRPFFSSSILFELEKIPEDEFVRWIIDRFSDSGIRCSRNVAERIVESVENYPIYVQKLCFYIYEEMTGHEVTEELVAKCLKLLIDEEQRITEAILAGLTIKQKEVLFALSVVKKAHLLSADFLNRFSISSSTVQGVIPVLTELDLIYKDKEGAYNFVNPVIEMTLRNIGS